MSLEPNVELVRAVEVLMLRCPRVQADLGGTRSMEALGDPMVLATFRKHRCLANIQLSFRLAL